MTAYGLGLFVVGLFAGWLIVRWGLRPVHEIAQTAVGIAKGDLSRRINVQQTSSEIFGLAAVLNTAFARLERGIKERERFTADASHELRTPLAVVLSQIQQLRSKPRTDKEYIEGLATAERAAALRLAFSPQRGCRPPRVLPAARFEPNKRPPIAHDTLLTSTPWRSPRFVRRGTMPTTRHSRRGVVPAYCASWP